MSKNLTEQKGRGHQGEQGDKPTINQQGNIGKEGRTTEPSALQNQIDGKKDERENAVEQIGGNKSGMKEEFLAPGLITERFTINIKASREKVWDVLWNDATYSLWTSVFGAGQAISDWKEGSKIVFGTSDGNGMHSIIARIIPNEFMSFRHIGMLINGEEQPMDEETSNWTGAMENYTLNEMEGATELIVDLDTTKDHQKFFKETFPKALDKVKELSER